MDIDSHTILAQSDHQIGEKCISIHKDYYWDLQIEEAPMGIQKNISLFQYYYQHKY